MYVGRVIIDEKFRIISVEENKFKDEIKSSLEFSIAKCQEHGKTNAYSSPNCGSWIANNRIVGKSTHIYSDENIIISE